MSFLACSILFHKCFYSGILVEIEHGLIFSIFPKHIRLVSTTPVVVWLKLQNNDIPSILECYAEIIQFTEFPCNNYITKQIPSQLVLLKLRCSLSYGDHFKTPLLKHLNYSSILQGENILIIGSPYGPVCPPVLLNNYFSGIVSKTYGSKVNMILIDTFCPPGLIGAPVFIYKEGVPYLYGLLLADSSSSNYPSSNKYGTIFPVVSMMYLLTISENMLSRHFSSSNILISISNHTPIIVPIVFSAISSIIIPEIFSKVVFVDAGINNGTGYLLSENICFTCAHLIDNLEIGDSVYISKFDHLPVEFKVKFSTLPNVYPDFAILTKINSPEITLRDIIYCNGTTFPKLSNGLKTFGIGFGCSAFNEESRIPLLSAGCVSNVIEQSKMILFGQISCSLNPGSSGGLLIEQKSQRLLGLLYGYAESNDGDLTDTYPQISRFIPFETIFLLLRKGIFETSKQFKLDKYVQGLWQYRYIPKTLYYSKL